MSPTRDTLHTYLAMLQDREPPGRGPHPYPTVRPKPAATLIVVDRSKRVPQVLMGRRNDQVKFLPGKFVFPGGALDPADRRMVAAGILPDHVETRLMKLRSRAPSSLPRAAALAAIRETFEETGLLIGSKDYGAPPRPPRGAWQAFGAAGVFPVLDNMHLIARAITPPGRIRRYDVAVFAVEASAIADQVEGRIGPDSELVELRWVPLPEAKKLNILTITQVILHELEDRLIEDLRPYVPVPFYAQVRGSWQRRVL